MSHAYNRRVEKQPDRKIEIWNERDCQAAVRCIANGFAWNSTKEGFNYWAKVYDQLQALCPSPKKRGKK